MIVSCNILADDALAAFQSSVTASGKDGKSIVVHLQGLIVFFFFIVFLFSI
jgi:hypothetical protein